MQWTEYYLLYPEGETQAIDWSLTVNALVDINGRPLDLPLRTSKQIVYRVMGQRTRETRNGEERFFLLELVPAYELEGLVGRF